MKKIIGTLLVGAMIGGMSFAELNSSLNVRAGGYIISKPDMSEDAITVGDLDGVTGTDAFTFKANNEYAGVTLNYNPKLAQPSDGNAAKSFWSAGNGVELTGYVKPASWLKLQIGAHKDGIFFAEQCKKDWDDTNWSAAGKYAGLYKLGAITKNSTAYFIDSLTDFQNGGQQYGMADMTFGDVGPGTLGIRLTAVDCTGNNWITKKATDDDPDATISVMPGAMLSYTVKDTIKVNFDFQMPTNNDIAFGIFASPLMVKNLSATVGFSLSSVLDKDKTSKGTADVVFSAFDLRVRYAMEKISISNSLNVTFGSEDQKVKSASGLTKAACTAALWDSLFLLYKANDKIWISLDAQIEAGINAKKDGDDVTPIDLWVTPGVVYNVGKGAAITTGLHFRIKDAGEAVGDSLKTFEWPIIMRVKM